MTTGGTLGTHIPSCDIKGTNVFLCASTVMRKGLAMGTASHLEVPEDRMVFNSRKQHPHGVGSIVQKGNPGSIQVAGQLVDVRLQLGKGWHKEKPMRLLAGAGPELP